MKTKEEIELECKNLSIGEIEALMGLAVQKYEKALNNEEEKADKLRERQLEAMFYRQEWLKRIKNEGS